VLPSAAILHGPQGTFVYAVKPDNTVEAKNVTVTIAQGNMTAVSSGLDAGDVVVTDGQDKLQTGSKIEPRSGAPPSSSSGTPAAGNSTPGNPAS
jgi:multidrug efflux system membrane fusion protein